ISIGATAIIPDIEAFTPPGYLTTPSIDIPQAGGDGVQPTGIPPKNVIYPEVDSVTLMKNISNAIDTELGTLWPNEGSVNVRELTEQEILARDPGTDQNPSATTDYELPQSVLQSLGTSFANPYDLTPYINAQTPVSQGGLLNTAGHYSYHVYELVFQGQAHDVPIFLSVAPNPTAEQWTTTTTTSTTGTAVSWTLGTASPPIPIAGDYSGVQGVSQYNAAVSMTSAGSMVAAYTNQAMLTGDLVPASDSYGN